MARPGPRTYALSYHLTPLVGLKADTRVNPNEDTVTLYRPVGQAELDLVREAGRWRFPPRLYWQPIFYPVLTEDYTIRIARDWNTKGEASGFVGYVLRFRVRRAFLDEFPVQEVGGRELREYWIPAERLEELNDQIVGPIEQTQVFRGDPP